MDQETPLVLARRPIFDDQQKLWGYGIRCLQTRSGAEDPGLTDQAISCLASSAYIGLQQVSERGKRLMVSFAAVYAGIQLLVPFQILAVKNGCAGTAALRTAAGPGRREGR